MFLRIGVISTLVAAVGLGQGIISTVAGNGVNGFSGDGGLATAAALGAPQGVAVDASGNVYFAETVNNLVRNVNSAGVINITAGCSPVTAACLVNGLSYGGPANAAYMSPFDVATDSAGNVYIADAAHSAIRRVTPAGIVSTVAGNGLPGYSGDFGPATSASLNGNLGMAIDSAGNLYVADTNNNCIRKIDTSGMITTVAGNGHAGFSGDGGAAFGATLASPHGVAVDSVGNLYISDSMNSRIRKVTPIGIISTIAGNGMVGNTGDEGPALNATMTNPWGIALDFAGNIFFADWLNNTVRKVNTAGVITTVAGGGNGALGDGGPAIRATLFAPTGIALDSAGSLYIADYANNRIRKVTGAGIVPLTGTPVINLVANAEGGGATIAPNTWVQISGVNLSEPGDTREWGITDFVNNQMPTALDGVSVKVNGQSAYVYYISPTQINILTPPEPMAGAVAVQVTLGTVPSAPFTLQAAAISPSLFIFNGGPYVAAEHANYSYVGPTTLYPGLTTPAQPGETVSIYGNGFGETTVPIVAGSAAQTGTIQSPIV
jgi:uncharacterized protein (TIGR03437 family)